MTAWTTFVTKLFRDRSKKNPDYKFKNALKDAAKLYKKGGADGDKEEEKYAAGELEPELEPEVASELEPELEPEVASELEPEVEPELEPEVASELEPEVEPVPGAPVQTAGSESCRFGGKRNSRRNKKGGKKSSRKMKKGGKKSLRKSKGSRASKKNRA
jgi:hypothetical protein